MLSAREMIQITGSRDMIRIQRDLEYLSEIGLLTTSARTESFTPIEGTEIAPTSLGLKLFARCSGHRGATQEFYGVTRSSLLRDSPSLIPDETAH
jgi:hypothetical protein